jgi:hypothetical protein
MELGQIPHVFAKPGHGGADDRVAVEGDERPAGIERQQLPQNGAADFPLSRVGFLGRYGPMEPGIEVAEGGLSCGDRTWQIVDPLMIPMAGSIRPLSSPNRCKTIGR